LKLKAFFVALTLSLPRKLIECRNNGIVGSKSGKTRAFLPAHSTIEQPIYVNLKEKERIEIMPEKPSREELLNQVEGAAHRYEKEFHGCSRCVLKALQDHFHLGDGATLQASTPLAAGVAMRGETCGALVGGLLAVGIVTAKENLEDSNALINSLAAGFRLARKIEKEFGTTNCTKIQTDRLGRFYSLADPEQYKAFIEAGGYVECPKVVAKIARITAEFILDYQEKTKAH
jgi:C_GCAxxG_C_C family probable redox protein